MKCFEKMSMKVGKEAHGMPFQQGLFEFEPIYFFLNNCILKIVFNPSDHKHVLTFSVM